MAVERSDTSARSATAASTAIYPIPLIRATTTGFIGRTERGPLDEPVTLRSFAEYQQTFGGHGEDGLVSHAVQDYFQHGGSVATVVRVANRATRAEVQCPARDAALILTARYPGRQEVLRVSIDYDGVESDESRFNLVVQRMRSAESNLIADQELFPCISIDPTDERFIVAAIEDSRLVRVAGPLPGTRPQATLPDYPGAPVKYVGLSRPGSDGDELTDYDIIGSRVRMSGLFAFEKGPPIHFLCIPSVPSREAGITVFVAAERICAQRRAIYVFDPPWSWESADQALAGARELESRSNNVLAYYPRIRPRGERARFRGGLPACGAIAGMLARRDSLGVWDGHETLALKGSLTAAEDLSSSQEALLRRSGVNVFVRGDAGRTVLAGNTILGGSRRYASRGFDLEQQRLLDFVLTSVEEAARFALAHFNGAESLLALERRVQQFLSALHEHRLLAGAASGQAFFVRMQPALRGGSAELQFGVALGRPRDFYSATIEIRPGIAPVVKHLHGLEADQLFA